MTLSKQLRKLSRQSECWSLRRRLRFTNLHPSDRRRTNVLRVFSSYDEGTVQRNEVLVGVYVVKCARLSASAPDNQQFEMNGGKARSKTYNACYDVKRDTWYQWQSMAVWCAVFCCMNAFLKGKSPWNEPALKTLIFDRATIKMENIYVKATCSSTNFY